MASLGKETPTPPLHLLPLFYNTIKVATGGKGPVHLHPVLKT